jgi:hypothetical protein
MKGAPLGSEAPYFVEHFAYLGPLDIEIFYPKLAAARPAGASFRDEVT